MVNGEGCPTSASRPRGFCLVPLRLERSPALGYAVSLLLEAIPNRQRGYSLCSELDWAIYARTIASLESALTGGNSECFSCETLVAILLMTCIEFD